MKIHSCNPRKPKLKEVWESPDGERICLLNEEQVRKAESESWSFIHERPHGDGRLDYMCGMKWCRCMQ